MKAIIKIFSVIFLVYVLCTFIASCKDTNAGSETQTSALDTNPTNQVTTMSPKSIIINTLENAPIRLSLPFLGEKNCTPMSWDELFDYYGVKFDLTNTSSNLQPDANASFPAGIYHYDNGDVRDMNRFVYSNTEQTKCAQVSAGIQSNDILFSVDSVKQMNTSTINDVSMVLGHYSYAEGDNCYYAQYRYCDVNFTVSTINIDEEEFLDILEYLTSVNS